MRWWRILPASHIPEAEMMTFGVLSLFIAFDSSLDTARESPGKPMGFTPFSISPRVSSSKYSAFVLR